MIASIALGLILGCTSGLKAFSDGFDDSGVPSSLTDGDDTAAGDDTARPGDPITYPSALMNKILLYSGHGGGRYYEPPLVPNFAFATTMWEEVYGWGTYKLTELPDAANMSPFRMVVLLAPGSDVEMEFSELEYIKLRGVLDAGGRVVVTSERRSCDNPFVNELLAELGVSITFTGSATGLGMVTPLDDLIRDHQVMTDTEVLRFRDPCFLDANDGEVLARYSSVENHYVVMAAERPGTAGDVVVIGDTEFMMDNDNWIELADNQILARNLATILPTETSR